MIPVMPSLSVRPMDESDAPDLVTLLGGLIAGAPYSSTVDESVLHRQVLAADPPTLFPIRFQQHLHLGVWRAGQLVGFLDTAVGLDSDNLDLPDYQPLGLIRFLALPARQDLVDDVANALFDAAQDFWQKTGIGFVKAFHISTGYPCFQAGAGVLPGDWAEHVRVLTTAGFRFSERFYCLYRALNEPVEEVIPIADLSLVYRGERVDRSYHIYYRRTDWVGSGRVVGVAAHKQGEPLSIAYLANLAIEPRWRQQNIGTWLLRRLINDATVQGYAQMVTHIAHRHNAAVNLLTQQGFLELNYRGYTLDKVLSD